MSSPQLLAQGPFDPKVKAYSFIPGPGATITWGPGSVTVSVDDGGTTWLNVTAADNPVTLKPEFTYVASGGAAVQFKLPPAAQFGDTYEIIGNGNLWSLGQNAGQSVTLGNVSSTPGVFGSVSASMISDSVKISCIQSNSLFKIRNPEGNPILN
jgi:hypothetical protein